METFPHLACLSCLLGVGACVLFPDEKATALSGEMTSSAGSASGRHYGDEMEQVSLEKLRSRLQKSSPMPVAQASNVIAGIRVDSSSPYFLTTKAMGGSVGHLVGLIFSLHHHEVGIVPNLEMKLRPKL